MENKILITGAAGFIGSHLVELLLQHQPLERLRLFVAKDESLDNLPKKKFDIIRGDIRDIATVKMALRGVSIVYHLAAKTIDGGKYYPESEYNEVNIGGTKNLLDECKKQDIEKFILFSSIAVYGLPAWVGDMENVDESFPKNPVEMYGRSKLNAETAVLKAHEEWGLPYAIVRPTTVYGPRDKRNILELYRVIKKRQFFFIGNGKNKMDYVFVKDLVKGARLAQLSKKKSGDYILGGGTPLTLREIVSCIAKSIGVTIFPLCVPRGLGLMMSYITYYCGKICGISSPLFPSRVKVLTSNCYFNIAKAQKELGYNPEISFEKGTRITADWLVAKNLI